MVGNGNTTEGVEADVGDVLQRDLDGMWFNCVVLRKHKGAHSLTYDVRYSDDGNTEEGVEAEELRFPPILSSEKEESTVDSADKQFRDEKKTDRDTTLRKRVSENGNVKKVTSQNGEKPFEKESITDMVRRLVRETKAFEAKSERLRMEAAVLVEQKQETEEQIINLSKYQNSLQLMHMASELSASGLRMEAASESVQERS